MGVKFAGEKEPFASDISKTKLLLPTKLKFVVNWLKVPAQIWLNWFTGALIDWAKILEALKNTKAKTIMYLSRTVLILNHMTIRFNLFSENQ